MDYTYSFIIPHHDNPALLNRCLDSIPVRDDTQIIVVDDNSRPALQPKVSRSNVEIISLNAHQSKGAGHARNVGLEKAKGKWLLFADCDDYYEQGFLDILDQYISSSAEVIYFNYNIKDESGVVRNPENYVQAALRIVVPSKEQCDFVRFRNNCPWDKMVSRKFVVTNDIQFEEVPNGNDILFSLQLSVYSKHYQFLPDKLYNYIIHSNSISTRKQTTDDVVCRIEHALKKNAFNKVVGYPKWNTSIIDIFCALFKNHGFFIGISVIVNIVIHSLNGSFKSKEWASILLKQ